MGRPNFVQSNLQLELWMAQQCKEIKPLYSQKLELSVEKNCLLWGHKIIVPYSLCKIILNES